VVAAVTVLIAALAGGAWLVDRFQNPTTPVTLDELLQELDATPGQSLTRDGLPEPGVYRYATVGGEQIDALSKPSRLYPAETAIVVTNSGCGVRLEWRPLQERSEWWEMCIRDGGIAVVSYGGVHEFFGNRDDRTLVCPAATWLVPPPGGIEVQESVCEGSGIRHDRVTRWATTERITVVGESVPGVGSTMEFATSGEARGTSTRSLVLTSRGLPLLWSDTVVGQSDSVIGTVTHNESFTLTLVSLDPA
jgi:hypothetical protein